MHNQFRAQLAECNHVPRCLLAQNPLQMPLGHGKKGRKCRYYQMGNGQTTKRRHPRVCRPLSRSVEPAGDTHPRSRTLRFTLWREAVGHVFGIFNCANLAAKWGPAGPVTNGVHLYARESNRAYFALQSNPKEHRNIYTRPRPNNHSGT